MNKWIYVTPRKISHENGFILELIFGSWLKPEELKPITVKKHSAVMTAGLIREGLSFAKRNSFTKRQDSIHKQKTVFKPGPNTLRRKKVNTVY